MKRIFRILFSLTVLLSAGYGWAENEMKPCMVEAPIDGIIGPATVDFFRRTAALAREQKCGSILLLINTPGGSLQSTRVIVEDILNSPVPVLCLVYPSGGHAGSAGAIIMQACHLNGAMDATNIGAATPISETGANIPKDLRRKILNDTKAWTEGLATLRGRSVSFARQIIEDAKAVPADQALKEHAIEFVANDKEDFLKFANGRSVKLNATSEVKLSLGKTVTMIEDLRYRIMDLLMNPQVAYLMLMASLALLYFEFTHPGMIAPGVVGGIGLIIALISMDMLAVTWGGVLLIALGIAFMIGEAFVGSFGSLGVGGIISFVIGSIFMFDPEQTGYVLPLSTILPTTILIGGLMIGIAYLAFTARRRRRRHSESLAGRTGIITEVQAGNGTFGFIEIDGELWKATSDELLKIGERAKVEKQNGLTLHVVEASDHGKKKEK